MRRMKLLWPTLALGLLLAAPAASASDGLPADVQRAWDDAATRNPPGWEAATRPPTETAAVVDATALEQAFDLAGALAGFLTICEGLVADWDSWEAACEGAARTAFGLDDEDALDRALRCLLARRPDHDLAAGRFPPDVLHRVAELRTTLSHASLEVADTLAEVELDGIVVGVAPLVLPRLPAGNHQVRCNGWSHTFVAAPGDAVALLCPPPATLDDPLPYLIASLGSGTTLADVESGEHGMESGTWVFYGAQEACAVLVHEPATGPGPWLQAVRRVRTPSD